MPERDFKGIWIPANVWLDSRLNALEKVILAEINSLDGEKGCWASNDYISEFCQCSASKVSKAISKLVELGYLRVESFNGRCRVLRSSLAKNAKQTSIICESDEQNLPASNIKNNIKNKSSAELEERFHRFMAVYPNRKAKQNALKAWMKLKPSEEFTEQIIRAVEKQKEWDDWKKENGKYIPYPATWLNQGRWDDECGTEEETKDETKEEKPLVPRWQEMFDYSEENGIVPAREFDNFFNYWASRGWMENGALVDWKSKLEEWGSR